MIEELESNRVYWNAMSNFGVDSSVIDPNDSKGFKNNYIVSHRNNQLAKALSHVQSESMVLDFGCGTGNISQFINNMGMNAVGVDIAYDLLALHNGTANLLCYDGETIPFKDHSYDVAVSYVVLNHLLIDDYLLTVLKEIYRVLKPGGIYVAIEQTCHYSRMTDGDMKKQRSIKDFKSIFSNANFLVESDRTVRTGHFPLIYFIRFGLIPSSLFPFIMRLDNFYSSCMSLLPFDYFDTAFVLKKPHE